MSSSNQPNQEHTVKQIIAADESAVKRRKTRPNQRKRRQIAKLISEGREAEVALLLESLNKKKNASAVNNSNSHSPKQTVTDRQQQPAPKVRKATPTAKQKEPKIDSTKKVTVNGLTNSDVNIAKNKSPSINPTTNQNASTKSCRGQTIANSLQNNQNKIIRKVDESFNMSANTSKIPNPTVGKTREEIMAEREAKKLAKQAKKVKAAIGSTEIQPILVASAAKSTSSTASAANNLVAMAQEQIIGASTDSNSNAAGIGDKQQSAAVDKTREQIKAEREAQKNAKQAQKVAKAAGGSVTELAAQLEATTMSESSAVPTAQAEKKKPTLSKAERRALQEAQRAAKAQALAQKGGAAKAPTQSNTSGNGVKTIANASETTKIKASSANAITQPTSLSPTAKTLSPSKKPQRTNDCKIRLFNHLEKAQSDASLFINNPQIHPSIAQLGEQYAQRTVVGSKARCIAFLNALKKVIRDFETPPKKEFARSLETTMTSSIDHLQKCRPLAVSVSNAYKHIKHVLTQLPTDQSESDLKENLCRFVDTYLENQIGKAAEAISCSVQEKISNGDVILIFGCSSLITYIFEEAQRRNVNFRVIIVDSRPFCEGQELLRRLSAKEIPCSYVLINAVSFVMPEATKVLLGAHALLANGYVMARTGTAQVALVAHAYNVPVLVCCETHKFSERSQTDAIVYNELGNPDDLIRTDKCSLSNWQMRGGRMVPLNLMYDITPPELVTAVVTEVSILPCTSVPVILRIKPTEIGY